MSEMVELIGAGRPVQPVAPLEAQQVADLVRMVFGGEEGFAGGGVWFRGNRDGRYIVRK